MCSISFRAWEGEALLHIAASDDAEQPFDMFEQFPAACDFIGRLHTCICFHIWTITTVGAVMTSVVLTVYDFIVRQLRDCTARRSLQDSKTILLPYVSHRFQTFF